MIHYKAIKLNNFPKNITNPYSKKTELTMKENKYNKKALNVN